MIALAAATITSCADRILNTPFLPRIFVFAKAAFFPLYPSRSSRLNSMAACLTKPPLPYLTPRCAHRPNCVVFLHSFFPGDSVGSQLSSSFYKIRTAIIIMSPTSLDFVSMSGHNVYNMLQPPQKVSTAAVSISSIRGTPRASPLSEAKALRITLTFVILS